MRLLTVELDRFRSRRAIVLLLLAGALLSTLLAATTLWDTRPISEADRAAAQAQAQADAQNPMYRRELQRCEQDPEMFFGPGATVESCADVMPRPEWYLQRQELSLQDVSRSTGVAVVVIMTALLLVIGTTFAGADWASGSMSNQLLFEPRRGRVWLAKAVAVTLAALVAATVVVSAFWVTLYLVAESRGLSTGATVQETIRWSATRGVLLAGAGALGAYALTMLLRHTVGALAVLFGYAVGGEILFSSLPIEGAARWSLSNNVFAWLFGGHDFYDPNMTCRPGVEMCEQMVHLTLGDGAWFLGVLLLVLSAVSLLLYRRRDIP